MSMSHFTAHIPVRGIRRGTIDWMDRFDDATRALEGSEFPIPASDLMKDARWTIGREPVSDFTLALFEKHPRADAWPIVEFVTIKFSCKRPTLVKLKKIITYDGKIENDDYYPYWISFCLGELANEVALINLALDLSLPGSSFYGSYVLSSGDQAHREKSGDHQFGDAYRYATSVGLHPGSDIAFLEVWEYLNKINGLREGVPDVPAGKVISALTYLALEIAPATRFFRTVWACSGLEGFFASGTASRQQQSVEKISLFLNEDVGTLRKQFDLLYQSRSKFIHGNKAISSAFIDVSPQEGKSSLDEWDAEHAGSYFLMETARECIRRGIHGQEFILSMKH